MVAPFPQLPLLGTMAGFRRFSVPEYHRLTEIGVLTEDDNIELIEGYLVNRQACSPAHECATQILHESLRTELVVGWGCRIKSAITLSDSEPEPDIAIAHGNERTFAAHHPAPREIGGVIEVAESTLLGDRADKGRIYARANIPVYWIVNLIDRQIEVYEQPSGPTASPSYTKTTICKPGDPVTLTLDGVIVTTFSVDELLP